MKRSLAAAVLTLVLCCILSCAAFAETAESAEETAAAEAAYADPEAFLDAVRTGVDMFVEYEVLTTDDPDSIIAFSDAFSESAAPFADAAFEDTQFAALARLYMMGAEAYRLAGSFEAGSDAFDDSIYCGYTLMRTAVLGFSRSYGLALSDRQLAGLSFHMMPEAAEVPEEAEPSSEDGDGEAVTMTKEEFRELLQTCPVYVSGTGYVVQDEEKKILYPNMLQAFICNGTGADIKEAVVAFAAWDKNNLPVRIKGQFSYGGGEYVCEVRFEEMNLVPGDTFGENYGYGLHESMQIEKLEAIVVSAATFSGETWENPYYEAWRAMYGEKKYTDSLRAEVIPVESSLEVEEDTSEPVDVSALEQAIAEQEVRVVGTEYLVQDEEHKILYPDLLSVIIQNDSDADIKNIVVGLVGWDENNLPVRIEGQFRYSGGEYYVSAEMEEANLAAGGTVGEGRGYSLREGCTVSTFKAIVESYEDFDGNIWENPLIDEWRTAYEGKKLQ